MRKVIKYFFITLLVLIILFIVFILFSVNSMNEKTSNGKEYAYTVANQITVYYTTHGDYPKRLNDLEVFSDPEFASYVNEHDFRYSTYSNNGVKYVLSWRAGAMNWTGYRCTNDALDAAQKDHNVIRTYKMNDEVICSVSDLH